jgi:hypothetical protein
MVLQPGESTTVTSSTFMMHAGMDGPHEFRVHLMTNDPAISDKEIRIFSNWVP